MQSVALHNAFAYQGRILILFGIGSDGNPLSNYYQAIIGELLISLLEQREKLLPALVS